MRKEIEPPLPLVNSAFLGFVVAGCVMIVIAIAAFVVEHDHVRELRTRVETLEAIERIHSDSLYGAGAHDLPSVVTTRSSGNHPLLTNIGVYYDVHCNADDVLAFDSISRTWTCSPAWPHPALVLPPSN